MNVITPTTQDNSLYRKMMTWKSV